MNIEAREVAISSGLEWVGSSYLDAGFYLVNGCTLIYRQNDGAVLGFQIDDPALLLKMAKADAAVGGGPSERFILDLIDKIASLTSFQAGVAMRRVRLSDHAKKLEGS